MPKKNQESYVALQEKLRKLEEKLLNTKEKLKLYGAKDSSENSDWLLLNENLAIYQTQIDWLKARMTAISQEDDKIIAYRLLETDEEITVQLTNGETEPTKGRISRVSPIGMALADKKVGEIAEIKTNQKKYKVQILAIK